MALGVFVAGAYPSSYNSLSTGQTERGYEVSIETMWENINQADAYAATLQDGIYTGSNAYCQYTAIEWSSGMLAAAWQWGGGTLGSFITSGIPIGTLASTLAKTFLLTATANTPAALSSGALSSTLTAAGAILAPNYPVALLFNSSLRKVPLRLQFMPFASSTTIKHFV